MNISEILSQLNSDTDRSGTGIQDTYVLPDFVVKQYEKGNEWADDEYTQGLDLHKNLDHKGLLPSLLGTFETENYQYLVLERIRIFYLQAHGGNTYDYIEAFMKYKIDAMERLYQNAGYRVIDNCLFNLGYKNNKLIVLDEGSLRLN